MTAMKWGVERDEANDALVKDIVETERGNLDSDIENFIEIDNKQYANLHLIG